MRVKSSPIDEAYENLANAIIGYAVNDYRNALKGHSYDRRMPLEYLIYRLEKFFRSAYFEILTRVDGEYLIQRLRAEHEKEKEQL